MKRGFFRRKKNRNNEEVTLQITSLADILIIVLIFLLKAYSTGVETVDDLNVSKGVSLPSVASSGAQGEKGLEVQISEEGVLINGKKAARLSSYRFDNLDLAQDLSDNGTSVSLNRVIAEQFPSAQAEKKTVWIVADRRSPYATIQTVIASVAKNGYSDFRLAVVKDE